MAFFKQKKRRDRAKQTEIPVVKTMKQLAKERENSDEVIEEDEFSFGKRFKRLVNNMFGKE